MTYIHTNETNCNTVASITHLDLLFRVLSRTFEFGASDRFRLRFTNCVPTKAKVNVSIQSFVIGINGFAAYRALEWPFFRQARLARLGHERGGHATTADGLGYMGYHAVPTPTIINRIPNKGYTGWSGYW